MHGEYHGPRCVKRCSDHGQKRPGTEVPALPSPKGLPKGFGFVKFLRKFRFEWLVNSLILHDEIGANKPAILFSDIENAGRVYKHKFSIGPVLKNLIPSPNRIRVKEPWPLLGNTNEHRKHGGFHVDNPPCVHFHPHAS